MVATLEKFFFTILSFLSLKNNVNFFCGKILIKLGKGKILKNV